MEKRSQLGWQGTERGEPWGAAVRATGQGKVAPGTRLGRAFPLCMANWNMPPTLRIPMLVVVAFGLARIGVGGTGGF